MGIPEVKALVMLRGKDDVFEAGVLRLLHPLVGIEVLELEILGPVHPGLGGRVHAIGDSIAIGHPAMRLVDRSPR